MATYIRRRRPPRLERGRSPWLDRQTWLFTWGRLTVGWAPRR